MRESQKVLDQPMGKCKLCHSSSKFISKSLGVCLKCIRQDPESALEITTRVHQKSRTAMGLPETPPKDPDGRFCNVCINECRIGDGNIGYCGLRKNEGGEFTGVTTGLGKLSWYHDPLPTNCVADWVCPGGTGAGYPEYAHCQGAESGYRNLAVFFHACSFNCLYCQNWQFKKEALRSEPTSVRSLLADVDKKTACICYFGGDPAPQLPFSLKAAGRAIEENPDRILRVCWETNGSMNRKLLDPMMDMALKSGGCVKFDLKAWDKHLHLALTGAFNHRTLENFARAAQLGMQRLLPPSLVASTLLVPGYIDAGEISAIAKFIAAINPNIPYSLLAFHPQFYMVDLPLTSISLADDCLAAARDAGLKKVRLGNVHLLV
jgi:pyruvate formate lyase activating enzyme